MDFNENIKQFSERAKTIISTIETEEATKTSLVLPLFHLLGYDIFNPSEFCPEFTADVGIKKNEKVDFAILEDGKPTILVECKSCTETLDKHSSQLFRYFGTSSAKFGILTNGIIYRFYTDLEECNKMDLVPFLEIDLLNLKDSLLPEFKKFSKENFDTDKIFSTAEELKYLNLIKDYFSSEFENPSDEFIKSVLSHVYDGVKTQKIIDKYTPLVKKGYIAFINELVNKRISSALSKEADSEVDEIEENVIQTTSKIVTTEKELEAFFIIRGMLGECTPVENITYRDTESYFGVLFKNNNRKPICRINLDTKNKQILIPDESKKFERIYINNLNDLYLQKEKLTKVVARYI